MKKIRRYHPVGNDGNGRESQCNNTEPQKVKPQTQYKKNSFCQTELQIRVGYRINKVPGNYWSS